jgi:hypothetical protein
MKRRYSAAIFVATVLCLITSVKTEATTLIAKDLASLSREADNICQGRVIDTVSFLKGGRIYTLNRVQIIASIKGSERDGEIIEVVTAGGHSELFSQKVFGAAELEVDHEYLLFLEHRGAPEISHTVGMTQGALRISLDDSRTTRLVHPPRSMPRLMQRDLSTGRLYNADPWLTDTRPLSEILTRVREYLGGDQ